MNGLKSRTEGQKKEPTVELAEMLIEITQSERQREMRWRESLRDMWDYNKKTVHVTGILGGEEKESRMKIYLKT